MNALVAVVDDDPRIRDFLEDELLNLGVKPVLYKDGHELFASLKNTQIDLILLDLMMPGMDGFACLKALRDCQYAGAVVVVTAHGDSGCRNQVIEAGASDYVLKPDLFEVLPDLLTQYLKQPPVVD